MERQITLLLNDQLKSSIFTEKHLQKLAYMGKVVTNPKPCGPTLEEAKELIEGSHVVITCWGCPKLDKELLDLAPDLEILAHAAGSVKEVVSNELFARGIRVTNCAYELGIGVAETCLALTITSLKNMWFLAQETRRGGWHYGREVVRELYGLKIGVVGAGNSGRHYIKLLQNFDLEIFLTDPTLTEQQAKDLGTTKVELEELIQICDVVAIHAPSIPETRHMFNKDNLGLMKNGAILINTARGALIDEDALVAELRRGRIFACLDVTDPEPPVVDHPFRTLPNVVLIPHIAGAVNNGLTRMGENIVKELERFFAGEPLGVEIKAEQLSVQA